MLCRAPTGQVLGPKHLRGSWLPAFMVTQGRKTQDVHVWQKPLMIHKRLCRWRVTDQIVSPDSHVVVTTPRASEHDCLETGS